VRIFKTPGLFVLRMLRISPMMRFAKPSSGPRMVRYVLPLSDLHVSALIDAGQFVEVKNNGEKISK